MFFTDKTVIKDIIINIKAKYLLKWIDFYEIDFSQRIGISIIFENKEILQKVFL